MASRKCASPRKKNSVIPCYFAVNVTGRHAVRIHTDKITVTPQYDQIFEVLKAVLKKIQDF
jgi:hypothetical protein